MKDKTTLRYDPEANAVYLRFANQEIEETLEISTSVYLDVDREGCPVGLEVLNVAPGMVAELASVDATLLSDVLERPAA